MRIDLESRERICENQHRENLRISMIIDLEVLSSFDLIVTTSTSDSECVCECEVEGQMPKPKCRTTLCGE